MTNKRAAVLRLLALAFTFASGAAAHAQSFDTVRLFAAQIGQDGGAAGIAVLATTEYTGSRDRRTMALPTLDYQWANGWFAGVTNGLGYNFSSSPDIQYGLRVTADLGRKESRSPALRGMGDIDVKAEAGGFLNYSLNSQLSLRSSLRLGSGNGGDGVVANLGISYSMPFAQRWRLGLGSDVTIANAKYMQSYFGVSRAQAAASGYAPYSPRASFRDVRASATLSYSVDPRTTVTVGVNALTLLGDASDSRLVQKKASVGGLLAATYAF